MDEDVAPSLTPSRVDGSNAADRSCYMGLLPVIVVACLIFFTDLGGAQLWDRDEPRNAGCAVEMLDRGDWVVPIFNDELRGQKPVLLYWLMMSAYQVFGINEFSARFWSAFLAACTVATTYSVAHRLFGLKVAVLGGIILSSNLMFPLAARAATPDSLLIFLSTLTIAFYIWGSPDAATNRFPKSFSVFKWYWLVAMGISMGLGLLAKGPIGFLMPMAIMGMHQLIMRAECVPRRNAFVAVLHPVHFIKTTFAMQPLLLLAIALLVALPWYVLVGLRTEGDFLNLFFFKEHLGRSTTAFENHSGGIWYYPLSILIGFFPWSLFWLPVAIILYRLQKTVSGGNEAVTLMLCWCGVQVAIFSIVQTKLPSYVTPCYPALSILTAVGLEAWEKQRVAISDAWLKAALVIGAVVGFLLAVAIAALSNRYVAEIFWLPVVGAAVASGCVVGLLRLMVDDRRSTVLSFAIGAVCFSWILFGFGTGSLSTAQNNRLVLDRIANLPPEVAVASYECLEPSWPFYGRRTVYETFGNAQAISVGRKKNWRRKPVTSPESFADQHERCVFITTDEFSDELLKRLPADFSVQQKADYLFRNKELVLIGR